MTEDYEKGLQFKHLIKDESIGGGTLVLGDAAASPQISKSALIFSYFMHYEPPEK